MPFSNQGVEETANNYQNYCDIAKQAFIKWWPRTKQLHDNMDILNRHLTNKSNKINNNKHRKTNNLSVEYEFSNASLDNLITLNEDDQDLEERSITIDPSDIIGDDEHTKKFNAKKVKGSVVSDLFNCRLCLQKIKSNASSVWSQNNYFDKILLLCHIPVTESDILQYLCQDCVMRIEFFYEFRCKCIKINKIFEEIMCQREYCNEKKESLCEDRETVEKPSETIKNTLSNPFKTYENKNKKIEISNLDNDNSANEIVNDTNKKNCRDTEKKNSISKLLIAIEQLSKTTKNNDKNKAVGVKPGRKKKNTTPITSTMIFGENSLMDRHNYFKDMELAHQALNISNNISLENMVLIKERDTDILPERSGDNDVLKEKIIVFKDSLNFSCAFKNSTELVDGKIVVFECDKCPAICEGKTEIDLHILSHKETINDNFQCDIENCKKKFRSDNNFKLHLKTVHGKSLPGNTLCTFCGKFFFGNKHNSCKNSPNKGFFTCDICDKKLRKSNSLRIHKMLLHTKDLTHKCSLCHKQVKNLSSHMLGVHTVKRIECKFCNKKFTKFNLMTHMRTHTGEMPFSCPDCQKEFRHNVTMKLHRLQEHKINMFDRPADQVLASFKKNSKKRKSKPEKRRKKSQIRTKNNYNISMNH